MMVVDRRVAVGVVAICLGACGGSTSGPTATAACSDYATKICQRAQACEPGLLPFFGYVTTADCVTALAADCQSALAAPHTGYTPARAQACGDALGTMTCAEFLSQTTAPACFPRGGRIAVGGSCRDGWQCASGACYPGDFTGCGTCIAPVPLGQDCTNSQCANNLVCSRSTAADLTPVCTTPVGIGGGCNDDAVCPVNGHCDRTTHTCARLPAIGGACDSSSVFFCDPTSTSAICDSATSLCEAIVVVQPGGDCSSFPTICANGICSFDADGGAGTCIGNVPNGGACTPADTCAPGSNCVGGTCQPLVCAGTPTDGGAAALVAASPWSPAPHGSAVARLRRAHKLGR